MNKKDKWREEVQRQKEKKIQQTKSHKKTTYFYGWKGDERVFIVLSKLTSTYQCIRKNASWMNRREIIWKKMNRSNKQESYLFQFLTKIMPIKTILIQLHERTNRCLVVACKGEARVWMRQSWAVLLQGNPRTLWASGSVGNHLRMSLKV